MKPAQLATLKFFSLLFLLPGLAGLISAVMMSTHYRDTLPRWPAPEQMRYVPRNIDGTGVYPDGAGRPAADGCRRRLGGDFAIGPGLGLVYLEQWGAAQAREAEQNDLQEHAL